MREASPPGSPTSTVGPRSVRGRRLTARPSTPPRNRAVMGEPRPRPVPAPPCQSSKQTMTAAARLPPSSWPTSVEPTPRLARALGLERSTSTNATVSVWSRPRIRSRSAATRSSRALACQATARTRPPKRRTELLSLTGPAPPCRAACRNTAPRALGPTSAPVILVNRFSRSRPSLPYPVPGRVVGGPQRASRGCFHGRLVRPANDPALNRTGSAINWDSFHPRGRSSVTPKT